MRRQLLRLTGNNLGHYFHRGHWMFNQVSLGVSPGQVLGISGYSGSGKTTLARILAGYLAPKAGWVTLDGNGTSHKGFRDKGFRPVQLIHQHPEKAVNPKWRMRDILAESYRPDSDVLEAFGIRDEWMTRRPVELSGGELQRFCIARALNPDARYIIADEMTTMVDAVTQAEIWKAFLDICRRRQIGLIVISHEAALLDRLCDKMFTLSQDSLIPMAYI